jgi:delta-1-pyrroline-5-carboxylate synthetase
MVAIEMNAQLLILLTDVEGVYDRPPKDPEAKLIDVFTVETGFEVGEKSLQGRGGMGAKVSSALNAALGGVQAVIIAAGWKGGIIESIMRGDKVGTLFLHHAGGSSTDPPVGSCPASDAHESDHVEAIAKGARDGGRQLQAISSLERAAILESLASLLSERAEDILAANEADLEAAKTSKISLQMLKRLKLTPEKISTLVDGIRAIAAQEEPLGLVNIYFRFSAKIAYNCLFNVF